MPLWGSIRFQDCYYHIGEYLGLFHEGVMCLIIFILSVVMYGLGNFVFDREEGFVIYGRPKL